jgi:hypothetical protein
MRSQLSGPIGTLKRVLERGGGSSFGWPNLVARGQKSAAQVLPSRGSGNIRLKQCLHEVFIKLCPPGNKLCPPGNAASAYGQIPNLIFQSNQPM